MDSERLYSRSAFLCRDLCQTSQGFHPYDIAKFHRPLYRDSVVFAFWRPQRRRSQGGEEEAYVFNLILANQGDSLGQPKRSLRAATTVRYNYYIQLVINRSSKPTKDQTSNAIVIDQNSPWHTALFCSKISDELTELSRPTDPLYHHSSSFKEHHNMPIPTIISSARP